MMPDTLMLLGNCDTRFASTIYCFDRIIEDESALKEFWSGRPLRTYLERAPNDLKTEHNKLAGEFIYNNETWDRINIFVDVESPIRIALRVSDSHKPNLAQMAPMFDKARNESLRGARHAEVKYPVYYTDLNEKIALLFDKRRVDIVTKLCLAASMVLPEHIYTENNEIYTPTGGRAAIIEVIDRYYPLEDDRLKAILVFQNLRTKTDIFGSERVIRYMRSEVKPPPDAFYSMMSALTDDLVGVELFRKLVNGYSGQGESERMNKQVKKFRTTTRNRQSHAVTSAYMELDTTYRMVERRNQEPAQVKFIDLLQEAYKDIQEEVEIEGEERDHENASIAGDDYDNDIENGDIDESYQTEIPDICRDTLIELCRTARISVENDFADDN